MSKQKTKRQKFGRPPWITEYARGYIIPFGQFKGRTLWSVASSRPNYIQWLVSHGDYRDDEFLAVAKMVLRDVEVIKKLEAEKKAAKAKSQGYS